MNQNIQKLKILESQGKVADSVEIRLSLMEKVNNKLMTLEEVQKELKKIQLEAHGNGLYKRSDILSGKSVDFEKAKMRKVTKLKNKIDKKLAKKQSKGSIRKI